MREYGRATITPPHSGPASPLVRARDPGEEKQRANGHARQAVRAFFAILTGYFLRPPRLENLAIFILWQRVTHRGNNANLVGLPKLVHLNS